MWWGQTTAAVLGAQRSSAQPTDTWGARPAPAQPTGPLGRRRKRAAHGRGERRAHKNPRGPRCLTFTCGSRRSHASCEPASTSAAAMRSRPLSRWTACSLLSRCKTISTSPNPSGISYFATSSRDCGAVAEAAGSGGRADRPCPQQQARGAHLLFLFAQLRLALHSNIPVIKFHRSGSAQRTRVRACAHGNRDGRQCA